MRIVKADRVSLRAINHNLLPVLRALLRDRNVTVAARSLGLTQPAVSKSLNQLRAILGDELLVRSGRRLILTRRGEELIQPVTEICQGLDRLWRAQTFDPAHAKREFVIAGTDYCAMLMVPALATRLCADAPGVSMRFVDLVPQVLIEERPDVDFAFGPDFMIPQQLVNAGGVVPLFTDDFVAVVAKNHPRALDGAPPPTDMSDTPSLLFGNDDPLLPMDLRGTMPLNVPSPILAVVQQFSSLPFLALLTGAVAVVPRRLIDLIIPTVPLHIIEGIVPNRKVQMMFAWHSRRHGDADHRWFRDLVVSSLR